MMVCSIALEGLSILNQAIFRLKLGQHSELPFRSCNYFPWTQYQFQETFHSPRLVKQGAEKGPLIPYRKEHIS